MSADNFCKRGTLKYFMVDEDEWLVGDEGMMTMTCET